MNHQLLLSKMVQSYLNVSYGSTENKYKVYCYQLAVVYSYQSTKAFHEYNIHNIIQFEIFLWKKLLSNLSFILYFQSEQPNSKVLKINQRTK